ncbi:uncharacterized protein N7487_003248, partial [Penicillium crustosum]|uniref:uncharacterized protein n=1 Tax=Penicillium crustosum TaxID=36656 RepID=UPI0023915AF9
HYRQTRRLADQKAPIPSLDRHKSYSNCSTINIVQEDLDRPYELFKKSRSLASKPIWSVFSVWSTLNSEAAIGDGALEERQGISLFHEALKRNAEHFIYSSVDRDGAKSINNSTNILHFIQKHRIEHHLLKRSKDLTLTWKILRPSAFYENLAPDIAGCRRGGVFESGDVSRPYALAGR